MHGADHTGPGSSAGAGSGTEAATRYIITRPCLAEGSLRLLKYLQPLFPAEGPVMLQDGKGERFTANVELARGRLTGMGELYRAHNMGVNDVLLLSRAEEGRYRVECVVKPHARPQTAAPERPAPAPLTTEKRVVIHATPHVREVRVERIPAEPLSTAQAKTGQAPGRTQETGERPASPAGNSFASNTASLTAAQGGLRDAAQPTGPVRVQPQKSPVTGPTQPQSRRDPNPGRSPLDGPVSRTSTPLTALTVQMQQYADSPARAPSVTNLPIQMNFASPEVRPTTPPVTVIRAVTTSPAVSPASGATQAAAQLAVVTPASPHPEKTDRSDLASQVASEAEPSNHPEDQLAALARLTGYTCDHLGSGVVRLRAELGSQSYSVLIATTPQALTTPAWRESCDYMALLTPERERPQGIPRFTYAALEALLEHARAAPLSPIDLRGYWNTGSFDHESASSVGELVKAQLTQRQNFSHVLETLAQQPANSLVHPPRLAERLGGGVNTAELHDILETLSRAPFLALLPLPNGQYYLRTEVRDLVQEFGAYAEGMQRRLRPKPATARA